ncbi:MAG: hypothetical protein D3926_20185 [Desulfobacteraceae bacterium]|nr:MAG: hypothetical protein D3926_20185 [Desulfobacteraceae bacterium]
MDIFLQVWGGGCYLFNKILFALAEGRAPKTKRQFKLVGWVVYIVGVPAWVIILVSKHDWIAASIEAGGVPSMLFGLYTVYQDKDTPNRTFDRIASLFTYGFILMGVGYSVHDYGGITSLSQTLEIGVMIGFLMGSYLLAKNNSKGWLLFMLMNTSMAALMFIQHKPLLSVQQLISLCFVTYGFIMALRSTPVRENNNDTGML